jgi:hypothetical protein
MNEQEHDKFRDLLKQSLTPMNSELKRDLWPHMLQRLDQRSASSTWFAVLFSARALSAVPWFDWALLVALVLGVCVFPNSIPIWLYHL